MPTIEEFAQTIKQKYPQYKDIDDRELGTKMIEKYPQYKSKVFDTTPNQPQKTEGVIDAFKKGFGNIKESFRKVSREEIPDTLMNQDTSKFAKTVGVTGKLLKPFATAGAEAVMTPARAIGEGIENVTGKDINTAVGEKVGQAVNAGLNTETGQKIISTFDTLERENPEAATVLSGLIDFVDFATMAGGGGSVAKQGAKGTLKAGEKVLSTTGKGIAKTGEGIGKTAKFTAGQTYGLNPETVSSIIKNPELFTSKEMAKIDRDSIFRKAKTSIDKRLEDLSETGKGYDSIKKEGTKTSVSSDSIKKVLKDRGIEVKDGKVISTLDSDIPLTKADTRAIQEVIGDIGDLKNLSAKQVLNLRKKLDVAAKWGEGKSDASKKVVREIRNHIDEIAKKEIPGLADLDKKFSSEIKLMKNVKKTIFNNDGTLKDNAVSKIATLTGKGKEQALRRIKKVIPSIEEDLNILKAVEDIQFTGGQKVGTYARTAAGAGGGAALGGPVGAIVGMVLTSPQVGVSILRNYGKAVNASKKLINKTINKMKSGKKLIGEEKKLMGKALEDASNKLSKRVGKGSPAVGQTVKFERAKNLTPEGKKIEDAAFDKISKHEDKILGAYDKKFGKVVNTDNFRQAFKKEGYKGYNAADVQEPSSYLSKKAFTSNLSNDGKYATMYAGGSGTGKTSAIKDISSLNNIVKDSSVILDSNLSSYDSAIKKITEAVKAGKKTPIIYVYRDPVDSFVNGVVKRMLTNKEEAGRLVPSKITAGNHIDSFDVVKKLEKDGISVIAIDNSLGKGKAVRTNLSELSKKINYPSKKELTDIFNKEAKKLYEQGKITKEQYQGYIK